MAEKYSVTGDQYREIDKKMGEIKRQLNQAEGSAIYAPSLNYWLQNMVEGGAGRISHALNEYPLYLPHGLVIGRLVDKLGFRRVDSRIDGLEVPYQQGKTVVCSFASPRNEDTHPQDLLDSLKVPGLRYANLVEILLLKSQYFRETEVRLMACGTLAPWKEEYNDRLADVFPEICYGDTLSFGFEKDDYGCLGSAGYVVVYDVGQHLDLSDDD